MDLIHACTDPDAASLAPMKRKQSSYFTSSNFNSEKTPELCSGYLLDQQHLPGCYAGLAQQTGIVWTH